MEGDFGPAALAARAGSVGRGDCEMDQKDPATRTGRLKLSVRKKKEHEAGAMEGLEHEAGVFNDAFASWSRIQSISKDQPTRLKNFVNLTQEIVSWVGKGLDKTIAVDEALELASAHGLTESEGLENI